MTVRQPAIDRMRGLVMALMAIDHAGTIFDAGHLDQDSPMLYQGGELALDHFLTRFVTHLCAPTFVFLAGTALALSAVRRGHEHGFDRHLVVRGAILIALDLAFITGLYSVGQGFLQFVLQVLFAIGASMICIVPLRRLGQAPLLAGALAMIFLGELFASILWQGDTWQPPLWFALAATTYGSRLLVVLYPLLPWLAVMVLGFVFGRYLVRVQERGGNPERLLVASGLGALVLFVVVRGINGYGNMWLPRADGSLAQWLHVCKYPPSLSFHAVTLGAMALLLAWFFRSQRRGAAISANAPLVVFGQTPLFFYLAHFLLLGIAGEVTGLGRRNAGLAATYVATIAVLAVLYPVCRSYRGYKAKRGGWTRYL